MVNLLGFLPKEYTKNKKLKIAEKCFYYIVLLFWGVICITYSDKHIIDLSTYFISVCVGEIALSGKFHLDIRDVLLVVGMGLYYIIAGSTEACDNVKLIIAAYYFGKSIILGGGKRSSSRAIRLIIVMAIGMAIESMVDFLSYASYDGRRIYKWSHFWSGNMDKCTHYAFYIIPISCLLFWAICSFMQHIFLSIVILCVALYCNYNILQSDTRMGILISGLCFLICACSFFVRNYKNKKVRILYEIGIIVIMLIGSYVVSKIVNSDVLFERIESAVNRNNGILHNARFMYMKDILSKLPSHLMGGIELDEGISAHNVWIDIARVSGIIPFILIVIYSCMSMYDAGWCLFKSNEINRYEYAVVGVLIGLYMYYMIEPALDSSIYFWVMGCIVSGIIRGLVINKKGKEKSENKSQKKCKKLKAIILTIVLAVTMLVGCSKNFDEKKNGVTTEENIYIDDAEYGDIALMGEGTKEDPYLINDYNDLIYFYNSVNTGWLFDDKYIYQTNDIDMSEHPFWPIAECDTGYVFLGTYDGGGHVIRNVILGKDGYCAIFGRLGGTIMNLGIVDGYLEGWHAAGLVAICETSDAKILNCYTCTTIKGKESVGIVGAGKGMVLGCYTNSSYTAESDYERISITDDYEIDGCYGEWRGDDIISLLYINSIPVYLYYDERIPKTDGVERLNNYVYEMSYRSGVPVEDFCKWELNADGNIRLNTHKADSEHTPDKILFREWIRENYPLVPIILGIMTTILTIIATIRIAKK